MITDSAMEVRAVRLTMDESARRVDGGNETAAKGLVMRALAERLHSRLDNGA